MLAVCILATLASIPGQTMGVGVFTDDLLDTLGLTRTQLSSAYMFGTLGSALLLPFAGSFADRVGARALTVLACVGLGIGVTGLSQSDRLAALFGGGTYSAVGVALVCFLIMRFCGQGCLAMVGRIGIGRWFDRKRGVATAISGLFVSFGFAVSPLLLDRLVEMLGWRGACLAMAVVVGGGMGALGWAFYRNSPESCGLLPDGDVHDPAKTVSTLPVCMKEFTRGEAVRTLSFWAFNLATSSYALIITGITFNVTSLGEEMGMSRSEAYTMFLPMSAVSVSVNCLAGWLSDRMRLKWLLLVMMGAEAIGVAGMLSFGEPVGWRLMIVGFGIAGGLFGVLVTVTWPRYFGRLHLGAVSGVSMSAMVFASAIAPVMFSAMHDKTGNYRAVTLLCWCIPVAVLIAGLWADNPQLYPKKIPTAGADDDT